MTSAPSTRAVANLHLHLEYDSGLDVIAAAMAAVPDGQPDSDDHRAHVANDVSSAVAHLLDIDSITPEGCPVRVTDVSMEVLVDIEDAHDHEDSAPGADEPLDPEAMLESLMEASREFARVLDGFQFTDDEARLVAQAERVAEITGPPPFEATADVPAPEMLAQWGILCGYLAEACVSVLDVAFEDLNHLTWLDSRGGGFEADSTQIGARLPRIWNEEYNALFFRKFILTLSEVTTRMAHGWETPSNIAQVLALSVIVDEMTDLMESDQDDLSDADVRVATPELVEMMRTRILPTRVVDELFTEDPVYPFETWFLSFSPDERVAPYACDDDLFEDED